MKTSILLNRRKLITYFGMLACLIFCSVKSFSQSYTNVAGVYQAYQYSSPVRIEGMNMYYILNKNGIVLMAFGSSSSNAFSDASEGIKSGRIATGSFSMSGVDLTMNMKKGTGDTYWTYNPYESTIVNGSMTLKYIGSL